MWISWVNTFPSQLINFWRANFSLDDICGCVWQSAGYGGIPTDWMTTAPVTTALFSKEMEFGGNVVIGTF